MIRRVGALHRRDITRANSSCARASLLPLAREPSAAGTLTPPSPVTFVSSVFELGAHFAARREPGLDSAYVAGVANAPRSGRRVAVLGSHRRCVRNSLSSSAAVERKYYCFGARTRVATTRKLLRVHWRVFHPSRPRIAALNTSV